VTKVAVADVGQTTIAGWAGGIRAVLVIRGDLLLGVDLTRARFESLDAKKKSAVVVLPAPAVTSPRLDQEKTKLIGVMREGLWHFVPGDAGQEAVVNHAYRHAQAVVEAVGRDPTLIEQARRRAEAVLGGFFGAIGWRVSVQWTEPRDDATRGTDSVRSELSPPASHGPSAP
jgi:hypothetical protein